jgi:hypothetical protein
LYQQWRRMKRLNTLTGVSLIENCNLTRELESFDN